VSGVLEIAVLLGAGVAFGTLAGLLGVGGGVFIVPLLVLAFGAVQQVAQATSLMVVLPTAVVATFVLHRKGVLPQLGPSLQLGTFGAIAAVGGSLLALTAPADTLRIVFAVFLALTGVRLVRAGLHRDAPAH
jgi:hypothetical protein